jgi:molecular chaperone DnaK (HSP70)
MSAFTNNGVVNLGPKVVLGPVSKDCKPVVVGIDFGTACSGIAYARAADPKSVVCGAPTAQDPTQVKVPTTLVELPDGRWEFGYAAEMCYSEYLAGHTKGTPLKAHLFRRFKMELKGKEAGFDTLTAESVGQSKTHSVMDLIVRSLTFLKDFALSSIAIGYGGSVKPDKDVQWVLTVPAIWNDFGKAFMRKAAFRAGMMETEQSENLMLVLEPEGASLAVHAGASNFDLLGLGSRFMVLDCGGGTVDITVHDVQGVGPLDMKTIAVPTGGAWGGDYVNAEFIKFLKELLGPDRTNEEESPLEMNSVRAEFDKVKVAYDPAGDPASIRVVDLQEVKGGLIAIARAWNENNQHRPIRESPSLRNGFLTMSKALMLSFFEPFLLATVEETKKVMRENPGIRHIMVVGGFGSSAVLTNRIRDEFHLKGGVQVILPSGNPRPQGAIVQGAVLCGLHKGVISSRVAPYTYGVAVREDGVDDVFSILVSKGDELKTDHRAELSAWPVNDEQTEGTWRVYRSDRVKPTTAVGEHILGSLTAHFPPDKVRSNRKQTGVFHFGGSEIRVTIENTNKDVTQGQIAMD